MVEVEAIVATALENAPRFALIAMPAGSATLHLDTQRTLGTSTPVLIPGQTPIAIVQHAVLTDAAMGSLVLADPGLEIQHALADPALNGCEYLWLRGR